MRPRWIHCLFLLAALLQASACSTLGAGSASPVVDRIVARGEIRIGMTGDYPPLNVTSRTGVNIGLEPDLARALATTLGVKLVVVNRPFAELIPALVAGEVDAVMSGMTMTPDRNLKVAFAGPYFISGKAILSKSATLAKTADMSSIDKPQHRLVVLEGSTSQSFAERAAPSAEIRTAPDYGAAVQMVIDGQVDALFADYPVCVLAVLRNPAADLATVIAPQSFEPIGMALPANDPLLLNLVQNYLDSLEHTGLLTQLRSRWFEDPSWLSELP